MHDTYIYSVLTGLTYYTSSRTSYSSKFNDNKIELIKKTIKTDYKKNAKGLLNKHLAYMPKAYLNKGPCLYLEVIHIKQWRQKQNNGTVASF